MNSFPLITNESDLCNWARQNRLNEGELTHGEYFVPLNWDTHKWRSKEVSLLTFSQVKVELHAHAAKAKLGQLTDAQKRRATELVSRASQEIKTVFRDGIRAQKIDVLLENVTQLFSRAVVTNEGAPQCTLATPNDLFPFAVAESFSNRTLHHFPLTLGEPLTSTDYTLAKIAKASNETDVINVLLDMRRLPHWNVDFRDRDNAIDLFKTKYKLDEEGFTKTLIYGKTELKSLTRVQLVSELCVLAYMYRASYRDRFGNDESELNYDQRQRLFAILDHLGFNFAVAIDSILGQPLFSTPKHWANCNGVAAKFNLQPSTVRCSAPQFKYGTENGALSITPDHAYLISQLQGRLSASQNEIAHREEEIRKLKTQVAELEAAQVSSSQEANLDALDGTFDDSQRTQSEPTITYFEDLSKTEALQQQVQKLEQKLKVSRDLYASLASEYEKLEKDFSAGVAEISDLKNRATQDKLKAKVAPPQAFVEEPIATEHYQQLMDERKNHKLTKKQLEQAQAVIQQKEAELIEFQEGYQQMIDEGKRRTLENRGHALTEKKLATAESQIEQLQSDNNALAEMVDSKDQIIAKLMRKLQKAKLAKVA